MEWLLAFLLMAYIAYAFLHREWRYKIWIDTMASCGLKVVDNSGIKQSHLWIEARAEPVTVRIEVPGSKKTIRVTAAFPGPPGFPRVTIRREADRPPGEGEIEIGDETFDRTFSLEGPTRLLSALLDADMRRLLVHVNAGGRLEISGGEIRLDLRDEDLPDVLPTLLDIARRLTQNVPIAHRLAENARRDPEAGVRLWNLGVLTREFPGKPGTVDTLRAACSDASPQVRLRAALGLGARGHDALVELAESLEDDACAAQAIARLGRKLPLERTRAILANALDGRHLQAAHACLEALGKSGDATAVDVLAEVMAGEEGELAAAAALALGATGSRAAEPPLLLALQRERTDLQVAASNALARIGTAAAVLPLKEAAERSPRDPELRRATRQAVAEIQSRLDGASPGQLSLDSSEAGQLSLGQAEAGRLSLAEAEAGRLALAQAETEALAVEPHSLSPEEPLPPPGLRSTR